MLGVLGIFKARGTKVFSDFASGPAEVAGGSITSMLPIKCAMHSQIYGPFLLNMALPLLLPMIASVLLVPMIASEHFRRKTRNGRAAPVYKGKFNLPRWLAVCKVLRAPMDADDVAEWSDKFHPTQRLSGVTVFVLFTLYPTLVASIASLYNCTAEIDGVAYLVADLTVECYKGVHIAFLVFASVGAMIYAVGIPAAVGLAVTVHFPLKCENKKLTCRCVRRESREYDTISMRSRFAFLFNGYDTNRSGAVVAWEALVMLRKLTVTLAGSMIKDPYLQILVALLILVVSCISTAYVQPYETEWLNLLDILGLFALIVIQIFSIFYFYVAAAAAPFADPVLIESVVTVMLFLVSAIVILIFLGFLFSENIRLRKTCAAKRSDVFAVASAEQTRVTLAAVAPDAGGNLWCHPNGVAVQIPPKLVDGVLWIWPEQEGIAVAVSTTDVELLLRVQNVKVLPSGSKFRLVDKTSRTFSEIQTIAQDVGGVLCCCGKAAAADRVDAVGRGVAMQVVNQQNPRREAAARVVADLEQSAGSSDSSSDSSSSDGESDDEGGAVTVGHPTPDWTRHWHETHAAYYWQHTNADGEGTQASQWTEPTFEETAAQNKLAGKAAAVTVGHPTVDWTRHWHDTHATYYWQHTGADGQGTQTSQWTEPTSEETVAQNKLAGERLLH